MPLHASLVGRSLGGYVLQGQVGSGGTGVVYRALDERLNRTVAIKVLHPKCAADDVLRERFIREGRTAARIDHPNVVRVISSSEEGGFPYLVMEYVDGGPLDLLLDRPDRLPLARSLRITKQLAEALAAAHRVGVMHRDVKPSNVLFSREGEPKLADFGLAREESQDHGLSQTGLLLGTPHYMSPEACEGRHGDPRSDIYSLGVVLYAMLEKRLPFVGDSQARILIAQLQDPVPPLASTPPAVAGVVYRALAKDPGQRWQSASEFAAALDRAIEGIYLPAPNSTPGFVAGEMPNPGNNASTAVLPRAHSTPRTLRIPRLRQFSRSAVRLGVAAIVGVAATVLATWAWKRASDPASELPRREPEPEVASQPAVPEPDPPVLPSVDPQPVGPPDNPTVEPVAPPPPAWELALREIASRARTLEEAGEYGQALAVWDGSHPPPEAALLADQERRRLLGRIAAKVKELLALPRHGPKAAAELRAIAARFPAEQALPILAAAANADKGWAPADGLEGLRFGFVARDPAVLEDALAAAGDGRGEEERAVTDSARRAVKRLRFVVDGAFAWYRARRGSVVELRRADGGRARGNLQAVDTAAHRLYIEVSSKLLPLAPADLAAPELTSRVLEDTPSDEALLAAVDVLLLSGNARDAWPVAIRARRRGLALEPDRLALLAVAAEDRNAAESGLRAIEAARGNPAALRSAARDWLGRYRALPVDPASAARARDALLSAGGPATAEDLALACAAGVTGKGRSFALEYDDAESLLADFTASTPIQVEAGPVPGLRPAAAGTQRLRGISWKDGVVQLELRTAAEFGIVVGWRSPDERFEILVTPATAGRATVTLPCDGRRCEATLTGDGWLNLRVAWGIGKISVKANGASVEGGLPAGWEGEIALAPRGPWAFRSITAFGSADFATPSRPDLADLDRAAARVRKPLPAASWAAWDTTPSVKDALTVYGGEAFAWALPKYWEAGTDYHATFRMTASKKSTVALELGTGEGRRRILLGDAAADGFVCGGRFTASGPGAALPEGRDLPVDIVVHGAAARISIGGKPAWTGHLVTPSAGGISVGVANGSVSLADLELSELEK